MVQLLPQSRPLGRRLIFRFSLCFRCFRLRACFPPCATARPNASLEVTWFDLLLISAVKELQAPGAAFRLALRPAAGSQCVLLKTPRQPAVELGERVLPCHCFAPRPSSRELAHVVKMLSPLLVALRLRQMVGCLERDQTQTLPIAHAQVDLNQLDFTFDSISSSTRFQNST